ncbi:hypothetical protein CEXT_507101 [Caerostris extrusa]|uniref:Uncharacterized protein n=1 Tax=Caerostris extrusa TaxID=172846 RepID=A0AAV4US81_CAEEX|nr:hypothetical protein CEXT_507101 [Caerostris extrusa]
MEAWPLACCQVSSHEFSIRNLVYNCFYARIEAKADLGIAKKKLFAIVEFPAQRRSTSQEFVSGVLRGKGDFPK